MKALAITTLFIISPILVNQANAKEGKSYQLNMLAILPFTGVQQRDAKTCMKAMDFAVNEVNMRSDILSDYLVNVTFQDEAAGTLAVKAAVQFVRKRDEMASQGVTMSPVSIGPMSGAGCQKFASLVHHLDLVMVTSGCSAPESTANRQAYPNLYRTRIASELVNIPRLAFVRRIANWRKIAILTNGGTPSDYQVAFVLHKQSLTAGVQVVWFNAVLTIDAASMQSLRNSGARVIVLASNSIDVSIQFLCETYRAGITGSKYVFMLTTMGYTDPANLSPTSIYPGCYRSIVVEQMIYTVFIGSLFFGIPEENKATSTLGYDMQQYDASFLAYINYTKSSDYERRHICFDMMVHALMTLNESETSLRAVNLSLRNYADNPREVMKIVNSSAGRVHYTSLRSGPMQYSKRLEMDDEPQYVAYWTPEKSFHMLYRIVHNVGDDMANLMNFRIDKINELKWYTKDGLPPRDAAPPLILQEKTIPPAFFGTLTGCSSLLAIVHFLLLVETWWMRKKPGRKSTQPLSRCLFLAGCLLLEASAISFSRASPTDGVCKMRYTFAIIGLSISHSFVVAKLAFLYSRFAMKLDVGKRTSGGLVWFSNRTRTNRRTQRQSKTTSPNLQENEHQGKVMFAGMIGFSVINAVVLVAWSLTDALTGHVESNTLLYDEAADIALNTFSVICKSTLQLEWLMAFMAVHILPLLAGAFFAYQLRNTPSEAEVLQFRLATGNSLAILIASTLIILIIRSSLANEMTAAVALLASSASTSGFLFYPVLKANIKKVVCGN